MTTFPTSIIKPHFDNMTKLDEHSKSLRRKIVKILELCGRGHVGAAFSIIEILKTLYDSILHFDPKNPRWNNRDRFILSKGHGCLALYVILENKGFFPESELWNFCKSDGLLGGHPEIHIPGVEASTGSLGHGLSIGVGMALNAKYEEANYRIFILIGDGESNEGSVWEAALCAQKHKLDNLVVLIDYNKHQSYGSTFEVLDLEPFADKWKSFGFAVAEVDGHNILMLKDVLSTIPLESGKPTAIICHTVKGKGVPLIENNLDWHHKNKVSEEEVKILLAGLE